MHFPTPSDTDCVICYEKVDQVLEGFKKIRDPCCGRHFHRDCVQRFAMTSGTEHFKCPKCNNREEITSYPMFRSICKLRPLGLESHKVSETSLRNCFFITSETGLRSLFLLLARLVSETFYFLLLRLVSEFFFQLF